MWDFLGEVLEMTKKSKNSKLPFFENLLFISFLQIRKTPWSALIKIAISKRLEKSLEKLLENYFKSDSKNFLSIFATEFGKLYSNFWRFVVNENMKSSKSIEFQHVHPRFFLHFDGLKCWEIQKCKKLVVFGQCERFMQRLLLFLSFSFSS